MLAWDSEPLVHIRYYPEVVASSHASGRASLGMPD